MENGRKKAQKAQRRWEMDIKEAKQFFRGWAGGYRIKRDGKKAYKKAIRAEGKAIVGTWECAA